MKNPDAKKDWGDKQAKSDEDEKQVKKTDGMKAKPISDAELAAAAKKNDKDGYRARIAVMLKAKGVPKGRGE